jgi:hypothetical protein
VLNILLLTSTIRPKPNQPELKLADPTQRLADYAGALEFQAGLLERNVIDRIVYVDNSGYDLRALSDRFRSPAIEWISFYDLDYDRSYHRGYGEFRLIDHAFRTSTVLAGMDATDHVWKITGRYVVKNLGTVIAATPRTFDLCCDVHGNWAEMGFMGWSRLGYEHHIRELWRHFATGKVPELIFSERLRQADRAASRIVTSFFWPPLVIGRRGSDGTPLRGRFTPLKFALTAGIKLIQLPVRRLYHRRRTSGDRVARHGR